MTSYVWREYKIVLKKKTLKKCHQIFTDYIWKYLSNSWKFWSLLQTLITKWKIHQATLRSKPSQIKINGQPQVFKNEFRKVNEVFNNKMHLRVVAFRALTSDNVLSLQIKSAGLRIFIIIIRWFMAFTRVKSSTSVTHLCWAIFSMFNLIKLFTLLISVFLWSFYSVYLLPFPLCLCYLHFLFSHTFLPYYFHICIALSATISKEAKSCWLASLIQQEEK